MPSFPPPHPHPRQKKNVIITVYISNRILEKSSRCDKVSEHTVTFLKTVSQNAPDHISVHIHFQKFLGGGGGGIPPDPPWKPLAFGHSELLPQMINPRQNPDQEISPGAIMFKAQIPLYYKCLTLREAGGGVVLYSIIFNEISVSLFC